MNVVVRGRARRCCARVATGISPERSSSYDLGFESVTIVDAEWAARRRTRGERLSLADRLCLALADRRGTDAWTADASWGDGGNVRQIR